MKKLLILASVLAMACGLQAASFTWGFANEGDYINKNGDAFDSGTAFLFLGTVTASESAFDFSQATYVLSAGYENDYFGAIDSASLASSDAVTSTAAGQNYSLLLFDTAGLTQSDLSSFEGNYVLYTGTSEERTLAGVTPIKYAEFVRAGEVLAGNWATMESVPEPTSGLLLLLGMAGLALKRKRA